MTTRINRRRFLGTSLTAASAMAAVATPALAHANDVTASGTPQDPLDAIVVGGGLSGLAAAKSLVAAGKTVKVIEARERAGGRVHSMNSPVAGVTLDAGAEFIGPTQDRIWSLVREYGLKTNLTYNAGDSIFWHRGRGGTRAPSVFPIPLDVGAVGAGVSLARAQIDALIPGFPVGEPWKHPNAAYLDSVTWEQYSHQLAPGPVAQSMVDIAMSATLSVRPDQLSALYFLNYIAAAGNERYPGDLVRLLSTEGGAQEQFFEGGAAQIPLWMASQLGPAMVYNAPVRAIETSTDLATVMTDAGNYTARKVIVAMSPAICGRIDFRPGLPADRVGIHEGYQMGSIAKFSAVYDRPFWRDKGLSGQVWGNGRPIDVTFESFAEGHHILMGFISGDAMRRLDKLPDQVMFDECLENFKDYFGPEAANPIDVSTFKWDNEEFSGGGPVAVSRPGTLTKFGPALRRPVGPIHWAGTETADYWTGYMDGAVRAGERAAHEVITAF